MCLNVLTHLSTSPTNIINLRLLGICPAVPRGSVEVDNINASTYEL